MDPLASVKEFRQQSAGPGRTLKVAPPPAIPVAPAPADDGVNAVDTEPTGELDLTAIGGAEAAEARGSHDVAAAVEPAGDAEDLPGMARGRKRLIHVNLPGDTRQRLEAGRRVHGTLGAAVMAALRGSYEWVVANHTPLPAEAVGPFPAPKPPRRRLVVPDARLKPFYVHPDEAKAIDQLAEQLELSVSELVTIAIDKFYEEDGARAEGGTSRDRAKK
jgi:hypothetical protein